MRGLSKVTWVASKKDASYGWACINFDLRLILADLNT